MVDGENVHVGAFSTTAFKVGWVSLVLGDPAPHASVLECGLPLVDASCG